MRWSDYMPDDVRLALEQFHANQVVPMPDRELIAAALREYLTTLGYIESEKSQEEIEARSAWTSPALILLPDRNAPDFDRNQTADAQAHGLRAPVGEIAWTSRRP